MKTESVVKGLIEEESRSRSGKHVCKRIILIVTKGGSIVSLTKEPMRIVNRREVKPTYVLGKAFEVAVRTDPREYVVQISLIRNFLKKVKGYISVFTGTGQMVYRAKYIDGELRRSFGKPVYAWIVRLISSAVSIPVKATTLGDEGGVK
ncbi:MAG: hypothetical protein N3E36_04565 [Sulfolobales archaeon]|nr:hypothetical protein [Sulfolobales archaeon]MCX8199288.1 hypothetical protein [Sulfolobales archaeon]MDW8170398.1 hypothetical protein [Desulfurococcaceae archaeon]